MQTFNIQLIEKVYKENNIPFPFEKFLKSLMVEKKKEDDNLLATIKEEERKHKAHFVYSEVDVDNIDYESFIKKEVKEYDYWYDFFDFELPDEGANTTQYFKIGNKLYEVETHCEAEWCGDWSVRANLPGKVAVISIKEITNYEILEEAKNYLYFKLN